MTKKQSHMHVDKHFSSHFPGQPCLPGCHLDLSHPYPEPLYPRGTSGCSQPTYINCHSKGF